ncbi:MAG: transglutaminase-like domain-containing protein [Candidatus Bathyarchaeia archaeon]
MKDHRTLNEILQKVAVALHNSNIDEAISFISIFREKVIEQISHMPKTSYDYLQSITYLTYAAMLYYIALALKQSEKPDNVERLVCWSEAFGINSVIECVLLPLLMADPIKAKEFAEIIKPTESYRENLSQHLRKLVKDIKFDPIEERKKLRQSIKRIIESVNPSSAEIRNLATSLTNRYEAGDFKQARRLYEFVRDEIRYIRDPLLFEDIQPPEITLKRLSGDCDDQAVLLCSLLLAIGFETALIFADTDNDGFSDHVYCAVYIPNAPDVYKPFNIKINGIDMHDWIPLDPTSEDLEFGLISTDNLVITDVFFFTKNKQYFISKLKFDS